MLEIIYIIGIVIGAIIIAVEFSQAIKVMDSTQSFIFLLLEGLKDTAKLAVWPVSFVIFLLQLPLQRAVVEDIAKSLDEHNGNMND